LPRDEVERVAAAAFLSEQLQLAGEHLDPDGQRAALYVDDAGELHALSEAQIRALPLRTWASLLPDWIVRRLLPKQLSAAEQAVLERLLTLPWPLLREDAFASSGCGEHRFRRIWAQYPEERKYPDGAPRGHRVPRKAPVVRLSRK
jgi:hypothetical protein